METRPARGLSEVHMSNPERVLHQIVDAVARGDGEGFFSVCRANAQLIFEHFAEWRTVPKDLRDKPEKLQDYFNALVQTAQLFQRAGHPELLALLMPPDEDNPLSRWRDRLAEAQQLADVGAHEQSLAESEALLAELEESGASGTGLIDTRARANGLRGRVLFRLNRFAEARAATVLALEDCERNGDEEGVRTYRGNLAILAEQATRPELIDLEVELLEAFSNAQRLTDLRRFKASNEVFSRLLAATGDAAVIVQGLRPHILGRMGFNEFMLGNRSLARELIESARDACSERGDKHGTEVYAENLLALAHDKPVSGKQ